MAHTDPTAVYPGSLPTTSELLDIDNRATYTLNGAISDSDTSLIVNESISDAPNTGVLTINDERIKYTGKDNGTKTFSSLTRGFDGSSAAAHSDGDTVRQNVTAYHVNVLNAELIALATELGATGSQNFVRTDGSEALTSDWDAGSFKITAQTFESDVTTGTAPLTVASTTVVSNLNADQVDGLDSTDLLLADGSQALTANWDAGSFKITAQTFESDVTTGTAPFTVASTTLVSNLNADLLDGVEAAGFAQLSGTPADNEVAVWTGSTSIEGASSLFWDGTTLGVGTATPNSSAALDITSTTGSLLVPRMTTTQRDLLTATGGMIIFNTTASELQGYNGSSWVKLDLSSLSSAGGWTDDGGTVRLTTTSDVVGIGTSSVDAGTALHVAGNDLLVEENISIESGTGFKATLSHSATAARTITIPDATTTLVGDDTTDTLTNKTLSSGTLDGTTTYTNAGAGSDPTLSSNDATQLLSLTGSLDISAAATIGTTLTMSSLTAGSVTFVGGSNDLTQDNSNLFWDDGNNRLGVGTNSPAAPLQVNEPSAGLGNTLTINRASDATGDTASLFFRVNSGTSAWLKTAIVKERNASGNGRGNLYVLQNNVADGSDATLSDAVVTIDPAGQVGIGTTTPNSLLELALATENLEIVDAGSAAATEQDWIEVQVGGVTGYIRVFATK